MYDYVKGYKAPLSSLPKDIKDVVIKKMKENFFVKEKDIDKLLFEIDVYFTVDIKNYYVKENKWQLTFISKHLITL